MPRLTARPSMPASRARAPTSTHGAHAERPRQSADVDVMQHLTSTLPAMHRDQRRRNYAGWVKRFHRYRAFARSSHPLRRDGLWRAGGDSGQSGACGSHGVSAWPSTAGLPHVGPGAGHRLAVPVERRVHRGEQTACTGPPDAPEREYPGRVHGTSPSIRLRRVRTILRCSGEVVECPRISLQRLLVRACVGPQSSSCASIRKPSPRPRRLSAIRKAARTDHPHRQAPRRPGLGIQEFRRIGAAARAARGRAARAPRNWQNQQYYGDGEPLLPWTGFDACSEMT